MKKTFLKPCLLICLGLVITTIVFASVVLDRPSPPINLKVENITTNSCLVSYQAPKDDGGTPIISYEIECFDNISFTWRSKGASKGLSHKVIGMTPGSQALIRVTASNEVGKSDPVVTEKEIIFPKK